MRLCSIASGSSGNCIYVGSDNTHLLVDVGISGKRVEQGLNSLELTGKDIDGILITHEHSDHIKGLGVIARKHQIPVYATEGTVEALSHMNLGKMPEGIFREIHEDEPFEINDLTVNPFTIPHDAAQPVGYRVECGEHSVGIATDLGKYNEYIVGNLQNLDALLLEANHDIRMLQVGKYPYYLKPRSQPRAFMETESIRISGFNSSASCSISAPCQGRCRLPVADAPRGCRPPGRCPWSCYLQ